MTSKLRILPLGGLGEIGKNMTVFEYEDQILIVDCGIMFPTNDMYGIDYIIPDYDYIRDKIEKVVGVIFTHGHEDHVGAVSHLMQEVDAPIYATPLTAGLLEVKLQRAGLLQKTMIHVIQAGDVFQVGEFIIEPFHMAHSIPDCVGFGITTPAGLVVHTGDYKFDHTPVDGWPPDFAKLAEFSQRGVLALLADSTNSENEGWTKSEAVITDAIDEVFENAEGRIILASFASLISRIQQVANAAYKHGRKLAITGRSMIDNVKMARKLGYLDVPDDLMIDIEEIGKYPKNKVAVMATGSQGEPTSVIGRLAYGRNHRISVEEGDTIVLSAHTIPGNEETVSRIVNRLIQKGATVLYERIIKVHVSGHASAEEMKLLINLVRPQFLIPVHGELKHLTQHARLAYDLGMAKENVVVVENGAVIEVDKQSIEVVDRIPGGYIYVDGSGVGDIGRQVMRDREKLAENGFLLITVPLSGSGKLAGEADYFSRGLTNLDEEFIAGLNGVVSRVISQHKNKSEKRLSNYLEEGVRQFIRDETGKRPFVYIVLK